MLQEVMVAGSGGVTKVVIPPKTGSQAGRIRLLQHRPAWRLHALLRFTNTPYDCENCELPYAMGQQLPLLIDGNFVFTERLAMEHISCGRTTQIYSLVDTSIENNITNDDEILRRSNTSTPLINALSDISICSFLENNLAEVTYKIKRASDTSGRDSVKSLKALNRYIYDFSNGSNRNGIFSMIFAKINFYRFEEDRFREGTYSYYSNDKLVLEKRIQDIYKLLSDRLVSNGGETLSESKQFSIAEATLFGHLAEVLSDPKLNQRVISHTVLMSFFRRICERFFLQPEQPVSSWVCAAKELAMNSFLNNNTSKIFLNENIISVGEQRCPFYEKNICDRTRFTTLHLFSKPSSDMSNVVIDFYGCVYLSAIFASFGVYLFRVSRKY